MFQDNTALTWMLVILNVIFFILAFAGLLFASIASRDMKNARAAMRDAEKLFEEIDLAKLRRGLEDNQPHAPFDQES